MKTRKANPYIVIRDERGSTYRIDLSCYVELRDDEVKFVDVWYNRQTRDWVVQKKDANDYQVGSTTYVGTREHADFAAGTVIRELIQAGRISRREQVRDNSAGDRL